MVEGVTFLSIFLHSWDLVVGSTDFVRAFQLYFLLFSFFTPSSIKVDFYVDDSARLIMAVNTLLS